MDPEQARRRKERNLKRTQSFNQRILGQSNDQPIKAQEIDKILIPPVNSEQDINNNTETNIKNETKNNDNNQIDNNDTTEFSEIKNRTNELSTNNNTSINNKTTNETTSQNTEIQTQNHKAIHESRSKSNESTFDVPTIKSPPIKFQFFSIRTIPFLLAPIFGIYPISYGFAILMFIDIMTFVYMNLNTFETLIDLNFDQESLKDLYNQMKLFTIRFTSFQFIIMMTRICLELFHKYRNLFF